MNSITHFQFNCQEVRFVLIGDEVYFLAKDIALILGYANTNQAVDQHIDYEDIKTDIELRRKAKELSQSNFDLVNRGVYTNESGVYALIFGSTKPEAKTFKRWLTKEVLPSIRKTGSYSIEPVIPQTYIEALKALVASEEAKELLKAENKLLEKENHTLAEAVDELFDYSSIIRIAKFNKMSEKNFSWYTLKVASIKLGKEIKQVPCPRFVTKNLYSHDAWRLAYPNVPLPETTTLVIRQ